MTTDARREARKAMMALAPDVASKKVYGADLPQGFQHESAQTSEENFPMEEYEAEIDVPSSIPVWFYLPLLYTIIAICSGRNDGIWSCTRENLVTATQTTLFC
jgi:hypothetical protein